MWLQTYKIILHDILGHMHVVKVLKKTCIGKNANFRIAITSEKLGKGMEAEKVDQEQQICL